MEGGPGFEGECDEVGEKESCWYGLTIPSMWQECCLIGSM